MKLPRYTEYANCGLTGIDSIPAHWDPSSLKRIVSEISSGVSVNAADEPAPEGAIGVLKTSCVYSGRFDAAENKTVVLDELDRVACPVTAGSLIVSRMNTPSLVGAAGLADRDIPNLYLPDRLWRIKFADALPEFVHFWTLTPQYRAQVQVACAGTSSSMQNLSQQDFLMFIVPLPPQQEQSAIADFLDRETAKIDALIAEQERLLELLAEKRQASITYAVTKGLNSAAPMKGSGVAWLGDVPAHWGVEQSRRLFCVRSEPAWPEDRMLTASQKHGVLYQADFVEREGRRVVEVILGKESLKHVEPDDFIISMRSFQGGLEWCQLRGSTSFHYVMITPVKHVYPRFFSYLFKSLTYIQALRSTTDLIRDGQELRYSNFVQVPLPVIPLEEQFQIADHLDAEIAKIDSLSHEAARAVLLLRERRSALIAAAVTGQFDVRGIAW